MEYQNGNDEALKALFLRYKTPVLNFSLRILGNRADAEDVVSDVFLALFAKKYNVKPGVKFSTWLFTVARNACITQIRKKKNMLPLWSRNKEASEYEQWDIPDAGNLPNEELVKRETALHVKKAVYSLPQLQKEAIVLREYHQLNYSEISHVLGCSLSKVKILIFRARERLKTELASFMLEDKND